MPAAVIRDRRALSAARLPIAWACGLLVLVVPADRLHACTVSASGVSFGAYNVTTPAPTDSTGSVILQCSPADKNIRVTLSTGSSGTFTSRALVQGSDQLLYNLYRDAAMTAVWGDGTGGTSVLTIPNWTGGPHAVQTHIIYGRIPPQQDVAAGSYSDAIVVTVDF